MNTLLSLIVWFLLGLGVPVQICQSTHGPRDRACDDQAPPPPQDEIESDWIDPAKISNGL